MPRYLLLFIFFTSIVHAAPVAEKEGVPYQIRWEGIHDHAQEKKIEAFSRLEKLKDSPPASLPLLQKRMEQDLSALTGLLQANGYYLATLKGMIESDSTPVQVVILCEPGPRFTIGQFHVNYAEAQRPRNPWKPLVKKGDPATSQAIRSEEQRLIRHLKENGYPSPRMLNRNVVVDPETHQVNVGFEVDTGDPKRFGFLKITGLESMKPKYIRRQKTWEFGELYDIRLVEDFESNLVLTGLFSRVRITPGPEEEDNEWIPLLLSLSERYARTVRLGVNYRSDVGFGSNASWEHRNMFGRGEQFRFNLVLAEEESGVSASIRKPGFIRNNQSLLFNTALAKEQPEAYSSNSFASAIGVERAFTRNFTSSLGVGYTYSSVEQLGEENTYALLFFPWKTKWDSTRSDLNPISGNRLLTEVTPYTDLLRGGLSFTRVEASGSYYHQVSRRPQVVVAGRLTAGSLLGADSDNIPASERYYSGGGGSVRGYDYQSIGPEIEGQVVGGNALLEVSFELRTRFTDTWGFATFIDGGMVTREQVPIENFPMQWGVGVGLRIFTGIGPLRLDVATPLNAYAEQTSSFQFYISLGQAF